VRRIKGLALELWLPVAILVAWWFASAGSESVYWPPLSKILSTFRETWLFERFGSDLLPSLWRFGAGFAIAVVVGVGVGLVLGLVPLLRRAFDPIIDFFRALPKPALLPILIVILGVGSSMKVFIIAFSAVWPILLNTIDGVRGVDPNMLEMSRAYGLRRRQHLTRLILPAASPQIFVGARISLAIALILMVVSEMVASTNGLGYFVLLSQQTYAIPEMWSGIIMLGIIGYLANVLFVVFERRALAWHRGWRAAALGAPVGSARRRRARVPRSGPALVATRSGTSDSAAAARPTPQRSETV
jgi:ABC-type nitrate/sulfonate/bicarbonate transport system permease component